MNASHDRKRSQYRTKMLKEHDLKFLDRENKRGRSEYWSDTGKNGVVVSAHYRATEAGATILKKGGNAIDAAVAVSAALGVVEPAASGLGGMAMMNIHLAKENRTFIIEGPCRAPIEATPDKVAAAPRKSGYKAAAVPTNPAVLAYALERYGTISASQVLEPAIALADDGYLMTPFQARVLGSYAGQLGKNNGADFFLNAQRQPFHAKDRIFQPKLAATLKRLAEYGLEEFYLGQTGEEILKDMKNHDGFLSNADFDPVPYPEEADTLCRNVLGWQVHTTPPPGGGISLLEMLLLFEELAMPEFTPNSPDAALLFASIIRQARKDRINYRLELTKDGKAISEMLDPAYIQKISALLVEETEYSGETTHFNVIDRWGNIVACTQSIERSYGSKVVTPSLGFLYNGFMKGFKIENKRHPHYLQPGAVARSNASPTLVMANEKTYAIGSTGSERMVSGLFETLVRLRCQNGFDAVRAPRLHCTPQGKVQYEPDRFSKAQLLALKNAGFVLAPYSDVWSFSAGGLHLACREKPRQWAVADPRRDGAAFGW